MKYLRYFLIAGIFIISIVSSCEKNTVEKPPSYNKRISKRSADPCFDPSGCTLIKDDSIHILSLPGYTPCGIKVKFDLYKCDEFVISHKYVVADFTATIDSTDSDCNGLAYRWDSLLNFAYDYAILNAELTALYRAAKDTLESQIVRNLFSSSTYRDSFACGQGGQTFTSEFYNSIFFKTCAYTYGSNPVHIIHYNVSCGEACCKKEVLWCLDNTLSPPRLIMQTPSYTDYGDCGDTPDGLCQGAWINDCDNLSCEP
ncbi:MAG: hypothetical protein JPMHGGIA_02440 [Saprospiraceae bacterium]|jgi:hypothetical protein|nr:hypothetical protein [Saprospiraceae bacterium]